MDCEPSEGRVSIRPNCVIYRRCIEEGENDTMREIVLGSALEADQKVNLGPSEPRLTSSSSNAGK